MGKTFRGNDRKKLKRYQQQRNKRKFKHWGEEEKTNKKEREDNANESIGDRGYSYW